MASELRGPTNFADDGSSVIERSVEASSLAPHADDWQSYYDVGRTVAIIQERGYRNIALQFPDELLQDADHVASYLKEHSHQHIYILADTSYGSCCVDEVAAQHASADFIVHYGRACLSPTSRIPVQYVFGKEPVEADHCVAELRKHIPDTSQPIIMMCDVVYHHAFEAIVARVRDLGFSQVFAETIRTELNLSTPTADAVSAAESHSSRCKPSTEACCGARTAGLDDSSACAGAGACCQPCRPGATVESAIDVSKPRQYTLPDSIAKEDCILFYVGGESLALTNIMMTHNSNSTITYNPATRVCRHETAAVNRMLMKRYYMVQKAKDAGIIGIVVGTLGVVSYLDTISNLKKLIISSGKKPYLISVGKPNPAKLGNFLEIDCFVFVACPENSLIDSREFLRPILTPFELLIALGSGKEWTGAYETDFGKVVDEIGDQARLKMQQHQGSTQSESRAAGQNNGSDADADPDAPRFSLITGGYVQDTKYVAASSDDSTDGAGAVALRNNSGQVSTVVASVASLYLNEKRTFKGLEVRLGETEVAKVQEGRDGIARGYSAERTL
ncbi:diphthamide biosynthesis protein 2 [Polychytrium aggregatum]|uniref:diphthamide biosynthesis protein 2 n=1 Tax=Polychytrium aggregatum TaxID=110093 RepID=UPI0022FE8862|nr:diphthamide biosynthesis protein 2 [Polychytrium aggregatum]KAI9207314.1 diphthamide biosynthesis protein 2 [Polychytrium aggregatum]